MNAQEMWLNGDGMVDLQSEWRGDKNEVKRICELPVSDDCPYSTRIRNQVSSGCDVSSDSGELERKWNQLFSEIEQLLRAEVRLIMEREERKSQNQRGVYPWYIDDNQG